MRFQLMILLSLAVAHAGAAPLDLDALQSVIRPTAEELKWREAIPWETDLWKARQRAAEEGKPIFLWEMDGHPLGCT